MQYLEAGPVLATLPIPKASTASRTAGSPFQAPMSDSLGYLNWTYGTPRVGTGATRYAGEIVGTPETPAMAVVSPWMFCPSRPFISPLELMYVPWTSSSRLLRPESFNLTPTYNTTPSNPLYFPAPPNPYVPTVSSLTIPTTYPPVPPTVLTSPVACATCRFSTC